ncbi:helix-turn-helix transcriptional regulator [Rhodobacter sp. SY28-1]|uniref:helix-turn-helix transcriptional regulator n=1 Tax=Rhodobacter sp. SY28-1 TaxID=2562317 RepID=UPI001484F8EA|nr:helix-turn-helix transcriptional regulator [Rhodobacter sp. SY28-1]
MKHDRLVETGTGSRADPFAPGVVRLRQAVRAQFRAVVGEAPVILRVEQGRKVVRGAVAGEVAAGGLALLPAGLPLDVENHPTADGPYRATAILIGAQITTPRGMSRGLHTQDARASDAFDRALDLLRRPAVPQAIRDHAVLEVLLWLDAVGLRLPPPAPPRFADRVRALVSADLARDWTAEAVAGALAVSEATLRRRLSGEGGFAALLTDLRMNRALGLLQGSDLPVAVVAAEVGYASPSRFALRFRARFGLAPAKIRQG